MSQRAAIRRRKQAKTGYKNLAPLRRPHYAGYSAEKSAKSNARWAENRRRGLKV